MIPVHRVATPTAKSGFDFVGIVRDPGRTWLKSQLWFRSRTVPKGTKFNALWRNCIPRLHSSYGGVCAYLSIYLEMETGAVTVDHFRPKSLVPALAYEWKNFRLCSLGANRRKGDFLDVLDPIGLAADTFLLDLGTGAIWPNPGLSLADASAALATIKRLKLDPPGCRKMRAGRFSVYLQNKDAAFLKANSPFVWYEANRQGLL